MLCSLYQNSSLYTPYQRSWLYKLFQMYIPSFRILIDKHSAESKTDFWIIYSQAELSTRFPGYIQSTRIPSYISFASILGYEPIPRDRDYISSTVLYIFKHSLDSTPSTRVSDYTMPVFWLILSIPYKCDKNTCHIYHPVKPPW